jgi:hypothetical protein
MKNTLKTSQGITTLVIAIIIVVLAAAGGTAVYYFEKGDSNQVAEDEQEQQGQSAENEEPSVMPKEKSNQEIEKPQPQQPNPAPQQPVSVSSSLPTNYVEILNFQPSFSVRPGQEVKMTVKTSTDFVNCLLLSIGFVEENGTPIQDGPANKFTFNFVAPTDAIGVFKLSAFCKKTQGAVHDFETGVVNDMGQASAEYFIDLSHLEPVSGELYNENFYMSVGESREIGAFLVTWSDGVTREIPWEQEDRRGLDIIYFSSDSLIASVDSQGVVSAHRPGLASLWVVVEGKRLDDTLTTVHVEDEQVQY